MKKIHLIVICLGILFICSSVFHTNIWFDEAYSVGMANHSLNDIWKIGKNDVHPVLYYWMLRLINILTNSSILAYRLFSVLPIGLLGILGYTHIRKDFGEKVGILFSFFSYFLPIMIVYTNQIRMYSWAIYIVTVFIIYAYRIYLGKTTKTNWRIFGIFSLASMYIHYYGLISTGVINVFLIIYIIKNKKWKELKIQIIIGIIQIIFYLPWLISLFSQVEHVSKGFWIEHEPNKVLNIICCQMTGKMSLSIGVIATSILNSILSLILFRKFKNKEIELKPAMYAAIIYLSVIIVALLISFIIKSDILYYRYIFVITGLYIFVVSYILAHVNNKYLIISICISMFILGIINLSKQINENYAQENYEPIKYLKENIQKDDILVYNEEENGFVFAPIFKENKQYFYNKEDWGVEEAYKAWSPQLETHTTSDFLKYCTGRIWIIDTSKNSCYEELFNNENYKYIDNKYFKTRYKNYEYNITLVERVK